MLKITLIRVLQTRSPRPPISLLLLIALLFVGAGTLRVAAQSTISPVGRRADEFRRQADVVDPQAGLHRVTPTRTPSGTPTATRTATMPPATATRTATAPATASATPPPPSATATVTPPPPSATTTASPPPPGTPMVLQLGVTDGQPHLDAWNDTAAVASGRALLRNLAGHYQNQHIMGWGADNPEPSPDQYWWGDLDRRIQLARDTGGTPVITLCCAPDWMKGGTAGQTDWSRLEVAPYPEHNADFAALAAAVARRYPDVHYFQVWNELKGFWDATNNRWNYEGYTALYNAVYDAVKAANPAAQIGGPYVVFGSGRDRSTMSNPSAINGPYGTLDQRPLDVVTYWLAHKHGADFVVADACATCSNAPGTEFTDMQKFADVTAWLRTQTTLPVWWAEWYATPYPNTDDHQHQAAIDTAALISLAGSGATVALRWQPEGGGSQDGYNGDNESLWSDTRNMGGGQAYPFYDSVRGFHDNFPPGTSLITATSSNAAVRVLASAAHQILVNTTGSSQATAINGGPAVTLGPWAVVSR